MSAQKNVQIVKDFFAAMGGSDRQVLLTLCADDIEWIIPGEDWPLAGTYRGPPRWKASSKPISERMPGDRNAAYCRRRSRFNQTVESPPSVIGGDLTHGRDEEPRQLDRQGWGATGFSCDPCLLPGLTVFYRSGGIIMKCRAVGRRKIV